MGLHCTDDLAELVHNCHSVIYCQPYFNDHRKKGKHWTDVASLEKFLGLSASVGKEPEAIPKRSDNLIRTHDFIETGSP